MGRAWCGRGRGPCVGVGPHAGGTDVGTCGVVGGREGMGGTSVGRALVGVASWQGDGSMGREGAFGSMGVCGGQRANHVLKASISAPIYPVQVHKHTHTQVHVHM